MPEKTYQQSLASEDEIQLRLNKKAARNNRITQILPFAGIVVLAIVFEILTGGRFLGKENLRLLLNQSFSMCMIMCGAIFLYALGNLDMAVGAVMSLSAVVLTRLYKGGMPLVLALLVGILAAVACMSVTALAKNKLRIAPFIASMCVMNVANGIVLVVYLALGKEGITFPYSQVAWLDSWTVKIIALLAMMVVGYILFTHTAFGKSLKAMAGSEMVARISGINVEKMTWLAYVAAGVAIGIAAMFAVVRGGIADTSVGAGMNLNIMIGVVLGGFPLYGGANARFSAPIIGALTVTVLTNGLGFIGYSNAIGYAIKGVIFLTVVGLTYEKSKGNLVN